MTISPNWTAQERLAVIRMIALFQSLQLQNPATRSPEEAYHAFRAVHLLTLESSEFLEANREVILTPEIQKALEGLAILPS